VYASAPHVENLLKLPFLLKEEEYKGKDYAYITGLISLSDLEQLQSQANFDYSIIAMDEEIQSHSEKLNTKTLNQQTTL
jgi:CRISPR/Cas system CMR-associated protein Cmr3 (group 5 of RAMP superfamily)